MVGTSGTLVGTARRLKAYNPAIQVVEVQPATAFHGLEGMKHMATALVPGIYDPSLADEQMEVIVEKHGLRSRGTYWSPSRRASVNSFSKEA